MWSYLPSVSWSTKNTQRPSLVTNAPPTSPSFSLCTGVLDPPMRRFSLPSEVEWSRWTLILIPSGHTGMASANSLRRMVTTFSAKLETLLARMPQTRNTTIHACGQGRVKKAWPNVVHWVWISYFAQELILRKNLWVDQFPCCMDSLETRRALALWADWLQHARWTLATWKMNVCRRSSSHVNCCCINHSGLIHDPCCRSWL